MLGITLIFTIINWVLQEGAFALCFKSKHFPGECVATRRGSPLLVGIKTKTRLATDHVPILYSKGNCSLSDVIICFRVKLFINSILD